MTTRPIAYSIQLNKIMLFTEYLGNLFLYLPYNYFLFLLYFDKFAFFRTQVVSLQHSHILRDAVAFL